MKPPFFGSKTIDSVAIDSIEPFLNKEALFASRWQFRKDLTADEWENFKKEKVLPNFERLFLICKGNSLIDSKFVYGFFECHREGNALLIKDISTVVRIEFPRERPSPNRSLADFFSDNFITLQLVTIGNKIDEYCAKLFKESKYQDTFLLKGMAAEFTEALANYAHYFIKKELGITGNDGMRFSPGYPVFPNLFEQKKIVRLLKPALIGIQLTKTCQLVPEHSTSAIISFDKNACLFRP